MTQKKIEVFGKTDNAWKSKGHAIIRSGGGNVWIREGKMDSQHIKIVFQDKCENVCKSEKHERSSRQEGWDGMRSGHVRVGSTATESLVGELCVSMVNACLVKKVNSDFDWSTLLIKIRSAHI